MKILFLDTETSGLPIWGEPSDDPNQPHVVEIAADLIDFDTREVIASLDCLVNNGIEMPADVLAIHGITTAMCEAEGISPVPAHERFTELVTQADLIVGHQISFDVRMMRIHSARVTGEKWENQVPTFCTMKESHAHVKTLPRKPDGWKWPPSLADTHMHLLGEEFVEAHRARPDCDAARRIYFHLRSPAHV